MSGILLGRTDWSLKRNRDSNRTYSVTWLVATTSVLDGPLTAYMTPGVPGVGAPWRFGNDSDPWALCWPEATVTPRESRKGDPDYLWEVQQTFSTEPIRRCQTSQIEDPLLEPPVISGGFSKFTKEQQRDRYGVAIKTSAGEMVKGPAIEVDDHRPTVSIAFNTLYNQLPIYAPIMNTVNDSPLWGHPAHTVRLSEFTWAAKVYGTCSMYFTNNLGFEIKDDTYIDANGDEQTLGFDKALADYGKYCIKLDLLRTSNGDGKYTWKSLTDAQKDAYVRAGQIERYKDPNGAESECFLDGHGAPWIQSQHGMNDVPPPIFVEVPRETNFFLYGVPPSLGAA